MRHGANGRWPRDPRHLDPAFELAAARIGDDDGLARDPFRPGALQRPGALRRRQQGQPLDADRAVLPAFGFPGGAQHADVELRPLPVIRGVQRRDPDGRAAHRGLGLDQPRHEPVHRERRVGGQGDDPPPALARCRLPALADLLQPAPDRLGKLARERGRPEAVPLFEQGSVDRLLQLAELLADRAGCHTQVIRGCDDIAGAHDRLESREGAKRRYLRH